VVGILLKLLPKVADMDIDGPWITVKVVIPPDGLDQVIARKDLAGRLGHIGKQPELGRSEPAFLAVPPNPSLDQIDLERSYPYAGPRRDCAAGPAQEGPDASQ
jgi:hypothetical protein